MEAQHRRTAAAGRSRAVIAVSDDLLRAGLQVVLSEQPGVQVVGECGDGPTALTMTRRVTPDLLAVDSQLAGIDGLTLTALLKREQPEMRVLLLTAQHVPAQLLEALRAGADACLLRSASRNELEAAVAGLRRGDVLLNHEHVVRSIAAHRDNHQHNHIHESLTVRELEVLRLLTQGLTNPAIAEVLHISRGTVKVHVERIIAKLHVSDRTQAAVRALESGLVAVRNGSGGY
jgi:DNA-binding NarL/FixJ family response regulator